MAHDGGIGLYNTSVNSSITSSIYCCSEELKNRVDRFKEYGNRGDAGIVQRS